MVITKEMIYEFLEEVKDPEIPVLNVIEMGIVRDVKIDGDELEVIITPTYSGCPAMQMIEDEIIKTIESKALARPKVSLTYSPPWTTDWLSEDARQKMIDFGIAAPGKSCGNPISPDFQIAHVPCPYCKSNHTEFRSEFSSTACKSLHYCNGCHQPFEQFKCI